MTIPQFEFIQKIAGLVAGSIIVISLVIYLRAVVIGRITSNIITWGIWTLVTLMLLVGYRGSVGQTSAIWVSVAYFSGTVLVFVCLFLRGMRGEWSPIDIICLIGAGCAVGLWLISRNSFLVLNLTMAVDIFGFVPLVITLWRLPKYEYAPPWWLAFAGNILNLIAVKQWDYVNAAYPLYLVVCTGAVALLVQFPKMRPGPDSYSS